MKALLSLAILLVFTLTASADPPFNGWFKGWWWIFQWFEKHEPPELDDPTPTPTPTPTPSATPSPTPTPSPSATPTPSPSATSTPTPPPSGDPTPMPGVSLRSTYKLLFHDEFAQPGIHNNPHWLVPYGQPIGDAKWSAGQPNNEFLSDGTESQPGVDGYPYSSDLGYLTLSWFQQSPKIGGQNMATVDKFYNGFKVRHGYFELRFRLPQPLPGTSGQTAGLWPGFWLQSAGSSPDGLGPEMDIFEGYSVDGFHVLHTTWHLWGPQGQVNALGFTFDPTGNGAEDAGYQPPPATPTFADDWNTIGLLIDSQNITMWINGVQAWQTPNPDDTTFGLPLYAEIQTAAGVTWPINFSWNVPAFPGSAGPPVYLFDVGDIRIWGDPAEQ